MLSEKAFFNAESDGKTPSADENKTFEKKENTEKNKIKLASTFSIAFSPWLSCPNRKNNTIMMSIYCLFFQDRHR